jgi:hypothetical protein
VIAAVVMAAHVPTFAERERPAPMPIVATGAGSLALGALGALLVVVTAIDFFLTVFNYDGFTTLTTRFHRVLWRVVRILGGALPERARHTALSVGAASMLPATVALWLGLEVTGFALMYDPGLASGSFAHKGTGHGLGTAFYLSAGAISSLTFGDATPRSGLYRALVDLETILGLATFTLALGYVVTTFGVLGALENLHGRVRRHAEDPAKPSSILARHFRGGQPSDLPSFLQALGEDLESYDQGLRRYPVVYYFHTRRRRRSIPVIFAALGNMLELLRWGLPADEPMTEDPFLAALLDGYATTLDRLRRSFVGPDPIETPEPLAPGRFVSAYTSGDREPSVDAFRRLEERARASAGIEDDAPDTDVESAYERYRDWLEFASRERAVLVRVADALGYERPEIDAPAPSSA